MIAEAVRDLIQYSTSAPFKRVSKAPDHEQEWQKHLTLMKDKWAFYGSRFEAILLNNNPLLAEEAAQKAGGKGAKKNGKKPSKDKPTSEEGGFLVGNALTYADVLVAHIVTWYVEECGSAIVEDMPGLVDLQNKVISLPSINAFIKSSKYYPVGDAAYVEQVNTVLARKV